MVNRTQIASLLGGLSFIVAGLGSILNLGGPGNNLLVVVHGAFIIAVLLALFRNASLFAYLAVSFILISTINLWIVVFGTSSGDELLLASVVSIVLGVIILVRFFDPIKNSIKFRLPLP